MERFYQFSGITVRVCAEKNQMYQDDGILSPFITENKEFDYSALTFFDDSLSKGEQVKDVLNNIYYGKDTNGNFNINNLVLHQELAKDFQDENEHLSHHFKHQINIL